MFEDDENNEMVRETLADLRERKITLDNRVVVAVKAWSDFYDDKVATQGVIDRRHAKITVDLVEALQAAYIWQDQLFGVTSEILKDWLESRPFEGDDNNE